MKIKEKTSLIYIYHPIQNFFLRIKFKSLTWPIKLYVTIFHGLFLLLCSPVTQGSFLLQLYSPLFAVTYFLYFFFFVAFLASLSGIFLPQTCIFMLFLLFSRLKEDSSLSASSAFLILLLFNFCSMKFDYFCLSLIEYKLETITVLFSSVPPTITHGTQKFITCFYLNYFFIWSFLYCQFIF